MMRKRCSKREVAPFSGWKWDNAWGSHAWRRHHLVRRCVYQPGGTAELLGHARRAAAGEVVALLDALLAADRGDLLHRPLSNAVQILAAEGEGRSAEAGVRVAQVVLGCWQSCAPVGGPGTPGIERVEELLRRLTGAPTAAASVAAGIRPYLRHGLSGARRAAVHALGLLRDEAAVPDLIVRLDDINAEVRREAARALVGFGGSEARAALLEQLDHGEWRPPFDVLMALAEAGSGAWPEGDNLDWLKEAVAQAVPHRDPTVRGAALLAVAALDPGSASRWGTSGLSDGDPMVRCAAIQAIVRSGVGEDRELIRPLCTDPDRSVRALAAETVPVGPDAQRTASPGDEEQSHSLDLADLLERDRPEGLRQIELRLASRAVGPPSANTRPGFGDEARIRRELRRRLRTGGSQLRLETARILACLGDAAGPRALQRLWWECPLARREVAQALGRWGTRRDLPFLASALRDWDVGVRRAAFEGVAALAARLWVPAAPAGRVGTWRGLHARWMLRWSRKLSAWTDRARRPALPPDLLGAVSALRKSAFDAAAVARSAPTAPTPLPSTGSGDPSPRRQAARRTHRGRRRRK
jgi:HEAT repeat protein